MVRHWPFQGIPAVSQVSSYSWPEPDNPRRTRGLKARALRLRECSDRALSIGLPGRFLSFGQDLCGYADWMVYLLTEPRFVDALLDKALEIGDQEATETDLSVSQSSQYR